jgi:shikimate kinase
MNLIFLYGPPATGKFTVGKELAKLIGYRFLDNHKSVEMLRQIFPFEDPELNKIRRKLQRKFRLEIFDEAAKAGVNFITTCAVAGPQHFSFYRETKEIVERHNGQVLFVQLAPTQETMLERVEQESRRGVKIENKEHLMRLLKNEPEVFDTFPDVSHLIIDNSSLSPNETAHRIWDYYNLS